MVNVYVTNVQNLPDPKEQPEIMQGLTKERVEKILKFAQPEDWKQSLGAGLLMKKVFEEYHISLDAVKVGANGKPEVDGFCFNLSHSGDFAVCAIGEKQVGCDIEQVAIAPMRLAEKYFCENEILHLAETLEEKKNEEFYRIWTMKESYLKMTGEGLRIKLNAFEIKFGEEVQVWREEKLCDCRVKEYESPGYKLTVCAEEAEFAEEVEFI